MEHCGTSGGGGAGSVGPGADCTAGGDKAEIGRRGNGSGQRRGREAGAGNGVSGPRPPHFPGGAKHIATPESVWVGERTSRASRRRKEASTEARRVSVELGTAARDGLRRAPAVTAAYCWRTWREREIPLVRLAGPSGQQHSLTAHRQAGAGVCWGGDTTWASCILSTRAENSSKERACGAAASCGRREESLWRTISSDHARSADGRPPSYRAELSAAKQASRDRPKPP
ncbi:hypothetical protein E2C01_093861 [Portunus trituberculatus]|uniref:Uncharacterized protein n=1 Tax=Portunus trituberculatus TaxID=210409 RepID=A0A5B7JZV8_PORTR|nr:hypothetical protein [Portunus trituberculatus]